MAFKSLDFTLDKYQELCTVIAENYTVYTVSEYLSEKPEGKIAVLRHDVDRKIKNSLNMAKREHEMGIRSSYYFRYPSTFKPDLIRKIRDLGHEIGYHYEVLSKTKRGLYQSYRPLSDRAGRVQKDLPRRYHLHARESALKIQQSRSVDPV